jgi:raffinose/stachyose/melibiose transport system permease protein
MRSREVPPWQPVGRAIGLTVYALITIVPLTVVMFTTFMTSPQMYASPFGLPTQPTLANFAELLDGSLAGNLLNSIVVTTFSVTLTLALASAAAYGIARLLGWIGVVAFGGFAIGLAVPVQVAMIQQYVIIKQLNLTNSLIGLILINIAVTLPIALPLSAPSLAAVPIFLVVMHWNDLLYPLLFITDPTKATLPKALLDFKGEYTTKYPVLFAEVLVASAPMIITYVFLQRYFVAGMTAGATKG